jgi:hypothetical protein
VEGSFFFLALDDGPSSPICQIIPNSNRPRSPKLPSSSSSSSSDDDDDDDDALPRHARHYTAGRVNEARQLASRLLRLVRGATTSSALVRSHLRDVEQALRAAATRDAGGAGFRRDYHGHGRIDDAVAAAAVDFNRVRALPAAAALVELMTPKVRSIHWFPYDRAGVVNADP